MPRSLAEATPAALEQSRAGGTDYVAELSRNYIEPIEIPGSVPLSSANMDALGIARLTEAQRVALRLFMERKTAKQIALELGITPKAVELRLKGARDALGVVSSAEAARILAGAEQHQAYRETLGGPSEVAGSPLSRFNPAIERGIGPAEAARDRPVLSEARAAFTHQPGRLQAGLGWPLPAEGRERNELGLGARLLWPFLAIFGVGASVGTLLISGSLLSLACTALYRALR